MIPDELYVWESFSGREGGIWSEYPTTWDDDDYGKPTRFVRADRTPSNTAIADTVERSWHLERLREVRADALAALTARATEIAELKAKVEKFRTAVEDDDVHCLLADSDNLDALLAERGARATEAGKLRDKVIESQKGVDYKGPVVLDIQTFTEIYAFVDSIARGGATGEQT